MVSTEKFCLKWNDFQQNIVKSFYDLRNETEFSDVTLVSEENQTIEAHRIILTACSPFFKSVLAKNKHTHPMIYMRGIKAKDLTAIMDFIYHGEASIYQEDLDGFLALAEDLQLKGLSGHQPDSSGENTQQITNPPTQSIVSKISAKKDHIFIQSDLKEATNTVSDSDNEYNSIVPVDVENSMMKIEANTDDLEAQIGSMMEKISYEDYSWKCKACGKMTKGSATQMKRHVEIHLEGVSYPCNKCGKVSRSNMGLINHMSRHHQK